MSVSAKVSVVSRLKLLYSMRCKDATIKDRKVCTVELEREVGCSCGQDDRKLSATGAVCLALGTANPDGARSVEKDWKGRRTLKRTKAHAKVQQHLC